MSERQKLKIDKKRIVYAGVFGLMAGVSVILGYQLQTAGGVSYSKIGTWLGCLATGLVGTGVAYLLLSVTTCYKEKGYGKLSIGWFSALCFLFLYGCWGIQLLGVYPGFFNYDAPGQWEMYAMGQVTAHHPVIHTLLISKCIHWSFDLFGKSQPGVMAYNLIQMAVTAVAFTQVFRYMYRKKVPKIIVAASLIWCGVFPTIVLSVLSVTKDSLFAPLVLSFVVSTIEMLEEQEAFFAKWYRMAFWGVTAVLMTIMRNNAVYVAIPFFVILIWAVRKHWKKYMILLAGMMLLYGIYTWPVTDALTVDGIAGKEYLSVPSQQLMRVYHTQEDLDAQQKEVIEELFEEEALLVYVPKIADVAKGNLRMDLLDTNKAEYLKFWAELGLEYPSEYADAFLVGNYGFWYPWATLAMYADGTEGYWVSKSYNPVWNESKIYPVMQYYTLFGYNEIVCENPFTMWIFAPATYFWITMAMFAVLLYRKRQEAVVFGFVLAVWLTFLLGPVALVRYVGFLYYLLPLEIALFIKVVRKKEKESSEE